MSIFTNPPSRSVEQAEAYVTALLELLEGRDPVDVLRSTPGTLRDLTRDLDDESLSRPEAPGKWSIRQVLRHLADGEIVFAYRVRMVLGQDRPGLTGYDQDGWAERLGYEAADVEEALDEITLLRRGTLRLVENASPEDMERVGLHSERGEESLGLLVKLAAGHDLVHTRQIRRIRGALTGS
jgi:hypothetical protein